MIYKNGTELQKRFVVQIADIELTILTPGGFLYTARYEDVNLFSFAQLDERCKGYSALLRIL